MKIKSLDELKWIIKRALEEDKVENDITTLSIVSENSISEAHIISRERGIVVGVDVVKAVFKHPPSNIEIESFVTDGSEVEKNEILFSIKGKTRTIISRERIALNFLQRLSGIATLTNQYVKKVKGIQILDTRKTTPTLRSLEKYAVKMGGGSNHRFDLNEMVLIKDNHIEIAGSIKKAIELVRKQTDKKIEVETKTLDEVKEAIEMKPDIIMLDNMDLKEIKQALILIDNKIKVELSGNVSLDSLDELGELTVDYISVGKLTHSPSALDISLEIINVKK
ncbi:MAG: carboxylating nicotinate-nucleotide diphosphorylase [Candidatus Ranarchaeia archaeon]